MELYLCLKSISHKLDRITQPLQTHLIKMFDSEFITNMKINNKIRSSPSPNPFRDDYMNEIITSAKYTPGPGSYNS